MQHYHLGKKKKQQTVWKQKNLAKTGGWPQDPFQHKCQNELLIPQNTWTRRVTVSEPILILWAFSPSLNCRFLDFGSCPSPTDLQILRDAKKLRMITLLRWRQGVVHRLPVAKNFLSCWCESYIKGGVQQYSSIRLGSYLYDKKL